MADLRGTQGSVTFSGSDGPIVGDVVIMRGHMGKSGRTDVTRPGYVMKRYSWGVYEAEGVLRVVSTDAAVPPLPTTTTGTLVLLIKTAATSQKYTFIASMESLSIGWQTAPDGQQFHEYSFVATATNSTDTIVAS